MKLKTVAQRARIVADSKPISNTTRIETLKKNSKDSEKNGIQNQYPTQQGLKPDESGDHWEEYNVFKTNIQHNKD